MQVCEVVMCHFTARSLHSLKPSVTSHFTAYPKQIEFDFGHFTVYYLLVGLCCPRVLIYVVNLISFIDLDLIKIVMWCEIDRLHVCLV